MSNKHSLSSSDRVKWSQKLGALPSPQFKQFVLALKTPSGILSGDSAPQLSRAIELLEWIEGPSGQGPDELERVCRRIIDGDPEVLKEPEKTQPLTPEFTFEVVRVDEKGGICDHWQKKAEQVREDLGDDVYLDLVKIPGGDFKMGSAKDELGHDATEGPKHVVQVPSFWMGQYPVTQRQWNTIALMERAERKLKLDPSYDSGENLPVGNITWYEAVEFCNRLSRYTGKGYRLPSEAEWEYACRAGTTTPFNCGETITIALANYSGAKPYKDEPVRGYNFTSTVVGHFEPNNFGLYDMHGNGLEWCFDIWHSSYEGAPTNGSAWVTRKNLWGLLGARVARSCTSVDFAVNCRSAKRHSQLPWERYAPYGFRIACSDL